VNPYDFVPVDWNRVPPRRAAPGHQKFEGISGRIEGTLTAETPLFLPAKRDDGNPMTEASGATLFSQSRAYGTDAERRGYFIPGSSLKGLCRSLVETIAPGCFWFSPRDEPVPPAFRQCSRSEQLCAACRLFGLINGATHRLGNVGFDDARCSRAIERPPLYTVILSNPKPRHVAFYRDGNWVAGRKYYFHHAPDNLLTAGGPQPPPPREQQNQHIRPLDTGSEFAFTADFTNVAQDDLSVLLYALVLEPELRHKFGYGKPCGLGSMRVNVTRLTLRDMSARYRSGSGSAIFTGDDLVAELARRTASTVDAAPPVTLDGLRRIWAWPPPPGARYRYPDHAWFRDHPQVPLSECP